VILATSVSLAKLRFEKGAVGGQLGPWECSITRVSMKVVFYFRNRNSDEILTYCNFVEISMFRFVEFGISISVSISIVFTFDKIEISAKFHTDFVGISMSKSEFHRFWLRYQNRNFDFRFDFDIGITILIWILERNQEALPTVPPYMMCRCCHGVSVYVPRSANVNSYR
jgi:hypothetical protein